MTNPGCPKRMVYGPCGGVRPDGGCEVDPASPCVFLDGPLRRWSGPAAAQSPPGPGPAPRVVTDLHVAPRDGASLRAVADRLAGTCDAVLVGDHGGARNDFPPSFTAAALLERGLRPWVTLSCRDRNRVALGAELAALADLGVEGVHCVTGDWEGLAGSAGEAKVFDLDSLRLVGMARAAGLRVSVAAAPAAPPRATRPARLAEKAAAGAQVCFVNHCGGPGPVAEFVAAATDAGADVAFVACVAVAADTASLGRLGRLPGVRLDSASVTEAAQPSPAASADVAVGTALAMLGVDGVSGVNLSGSASSRSPEASAAIMASVGHQVLAAAAGKRR